jgi:1-acyl-sn-glycerol-3-phosphate acyltransferase
MDRRFMIWLRSLAFNIVFYGWTALMCFLMVWTFVLPYRLLLVFVRMWLRHITWMERHIAGITYAVKGRDHLPAGACIIAAKHQSAWETFKIHMLFDDPAVVLKKELLEIPLWGRYLARSGMIPIDRKGGAKALSEMMAAAHKAAEQGRKIVIFPQGTRIPPGVDRPYKNGVAALYRELNVPVIPMAVNSGLCWPKNSFIKTPGKITIEFLPPIMPGLAREDFMARLKNELEGASNRLIGEARKI